MRHGYTSPFPRETLTSPFLAKAGTSICSRASRFRVPFAPRTHLLTARRRRWRQLASKACASNPITGPKPLGNWTPCWWMLRRGKFGYTTRFCGKTNNLKNLPKTEHDQTRFVINETYLLREKCNGDRRRIRPHRDQTTIRRRWMRRIRARAEMIAPNSYKYKSLTSGEWR